MSLQKKHAVFFILVATLFILIIGMFIRPS